MVGILIVIGAFVVVVLAAIVLTYNGLISKRNRVQDAWAQIDVQLKRRYDLIPNLVETVKGYMKYEKGVLTKITQLRSSIVSGSVQDKASANNKLSQALKSIFAVAENYPDLKANQEFLQLQAALNEIEEQIAAARRAYNAAVTDYNNAVQMFPTSILAAAMGLQAKSVFAAEASDRENPNVAQMFKS